MIWIQNSELFIFLFIKYKHWGSQFKCSCVILHDDITFQYFLVSNSSKTTAREP